MLLACLCLSFLSVLSQEGLPFTGPGAVPASPAVGASAAFHLIGDCVCTVGCAGDHAAGRRTICWYPTTSHTILLLFPPDSFDGFPACLAQSCCVSTLCCCNRSPNAVCTASPNTLHCSTATTACQTEPLMHGWDHTPMKTRL